MQDVDDKKGRDTLMKGAESDAHDFGFATKKKLFWDLVVGPLGQSPHTTAIPPGSLGQSPLDPGLSPKLYPGTYYRLQKQKTFHCLLLLYHQNSEESD